MEAPMTVAEMPEFQKATCLSEDERHAVIDFLATNPTAGVLIPGTGGLRKLRWAISGRGSRGGARVIYYFHSEAMPLLMITAYSKTVRADLTQTEKRTIRQLLPKLVDAFLKKKKE